VTKSASDQENAKPNSQDETLSEKMEGVPVTMVIEQYYTRLIIVLNKIVQYYAVITSAIFCLSHKFATE